VDERKDAEATELRQQLREQAERLTLALQAANLGTWEHVPGSHATLWDARSKSIFGLGEHEELDFESYVAAIHPGDVERVFAGITKAMDPASGGECSLQYRIHPRGADEWRWVEAHGRCTFDGSKPIRINGTLLDITERMQAEEALREATRQKDEFLAVLGHELRNPLAPMLTALELMKLRYPDVAVREREVIDRQLKHMMRLVDDLLDLGRVTRGALTLQRKVLELANVVEHAVEIASPLFEAKQHRLTVAVASGLHVSVDPVRFSQIIANLLTNAAKFTDPGGHVKLRASRDGNTAVLEVEDDGRGIEADQLERIFQPFVQAGNEERASTGGLGLGLSLVRDLAGLHGGNVAAFSEGPGRGSRFVVKMPLAAESPEAVSTPEAGPLPAPGKRVLVVDDNEDAAEMMSLVLAQRGHDVRVATDGLAALSLIEDFRPEVAVLDLGLPLLDGYELAARLRDRLAGELEQLIAVTGYGQPEDRARTQAAGFDRHLVKPVDLSELEAAIVAARK
jgi:PAS domain S-box-containing protein